VPAHSPLTNLFSLLPNRHILHANTTLDKNLLKSIRILQKIKDSTTSSFRKKSDKLHRAQKLLLDTLYLIHTLSDEEYKSARDYRRQLPPEDQRELEGSYSENILFAAQALSHGFRIRGIEQFTTDLYEPAKEVCASLEALRYVLNRAACTTPGILTSTFAMGQEEHKVVLERVFGALFDFDKAWTQFERSICFCYFSVTYSGRPGQVDQTDMFQVKCQPILKLLHGSKALFLQDSGIYFLTCTFLWIFKL
jgi:hypothetical protein